MDPDQTAFEERSDLCLHSQKGFLLNISATVLCP